MNISSKKQNMPEAGRELDALIAEKVFGSKIDDTKWLFVWPL